MAKIRENDELTRDQRKAILDERAQFLAQATTTIARQANQLDVVELVVAGEKFAIEARYVREASKLQALTPLPCTPDFVLGLMNFRGQILPLLDLRRLLELTDKAAGSDVQVVVVQTSTAQAGIAVDEITGISSIPEHDLQAPGQLVRPNLVQLVKGVRIDRLAVLDLEALFSDPRFIVESLP